MLSMVHATFGPGGSGLSRAPPWAPPNRMLQRTRLRPVAERQNRLPENAGVGRVEPSGFWGEPGPVGAAGRCPGSVPSGLSHGPEHSRDDLQSPLELLSGGMRVLEAAEIRRLRAKKMA
jgi:hypothetical protein